jgi:hypothetical protein
MVMWANEPYYEPWPLSRRHFEFPQHHAGYQLVVNERNNLTSPQQILNLNRELYNYIHAKPIIPDMPIYSRTNKSVISVHQQIFYFSITPKYVCQFSPSQYWRSSSGTHSGQESGCPSALHGTSLSLLQSTPVHRATGRGATTILSRTRATSKSHPKWIKRKK